MVSEKRLIDANAFHAYLEDLRQDYLAEDTQSSNFAADIIETVQDVYLANAPAVDAVEVAHGKWNGEADGYADGMLVYDVWYCSECNYCIDGEDDPEYLPNYCPNCGAKMDGGADHGI